MALHERARRRARESHAVRLEADLARAELQTLQMQLQPHFLFNTLHAIAVLIDENPKAASRMIAQLGDLLRETLRLSGTPEVPLGREIDLLKQYLLIEETRLGDRLTVKFDVQHDLLSVNVPSFILQPIVENAVRHGIAPRMEGGHLRIGAERAGQCVRITISDDGPGFAEERNGGIGLSSTRERLALRYRDHATLACATGLNGGAVVTLDIPLNNV
jgi:two-component system, LytTR family, sensor kinase